MVISVVYLLVRRLLGCLMVLTRRQMSSDAELLVLRHENTVLRRQINRVRYQPAGRLRIATLSRLIPWCRWGQVFMVTPATLLNWHRRLAARTWDYTGGRVNFHAEGDDHMMTALGVQSKREITRARIRARTAMAAQAREQGRYLGGRPPYGYSGWPTPGLTRTRRTRPGDGGPCGWSPTRTPHRS